jgi:alkaline phosphatase
MPQTASSQNHLIAPQAKGQLDQFSGATRLTKERSEALKASIDSRHVKHVILFIGDGTSDSEITIARNYVEGAGYFKGIDVAIYRQLYHLFNQ